MASRTNSDAVIALLQDDYGPLADGTLPDLTPRIESASVTVSRVKTGALSAKGISMSFEELEIIERWLAAHLYAVTDKPYQSKTTGGASASFNGQTGMGFESTLYGQTAMNLDYSGVLTNINKRQFARSAWLGKPRSEQLSWEDRNGGRD